MMCVSIILLNILIAQLSLTYELVQEESLHSFTALRMQTVATIEWQSRFKFWVSKYVVTSHDLCNFISLCRIRKNTNIKRDVVTDF